MAAWAQKLPEPPLLPLMIADNDTASLGRHIYDTEPIPGQKMAYLVDPGALCSDTS